MVRKLERYAVLALVSFAFICLIAYWIKKFATGTGFLSRDWTLLIATIGLAAWIRREAVSVRSGAASGDALREAPQLRSELSGASTDSAYLSDGFRRRIGKIRPWSIALVASFAALLPVLFLQLDLRERGGPPEAADIFRLAAFELFIIAGIVIAWIRLRRPGSGG